MQDPFATINRKTLDARSIYSQLSRPDFTYLWENATDEMKNTLLDAIEKLDKELVKRWIRCNPVLDFAEMSLTLLRKLGKRYNILNFGRLTKPELIRQILRNSSYERDRKEGTVTKNITFFKTEETGEVT